MILKVDVFSKVRPHHCYGRRGDEVELIRDDDTVCIVQNSSGDRFPVLKSKISFKSDETIDEGQSGAPQDLAPMVQASHRTVARKSKPTPGGSPPNSPQHTLF